MKKPEWLCGSAVETEKMDKALDFFEKSWEIKSHPLRNIARDTATMIGVGALMSAVLPSAGIALVGLGVVTGLLNLMVLGKESSSKEKTTDSLRSIWWETKSEVSMRRALNEMDEKTVSDLHAIAEQMETASSSEKMKSLSAMVFQETRRILELKKKQKLDATEDQRLLTLARETRPEMFTGAAWKPSDLISKLGVLGALGVDGVAAATMAAGLLKDKALDKQGVSELNRITEEILPRLLDAYERIPEGERDSKLDGLNKTPKESFTEGMTIALERVLAVRQGLTNKAKIVVEAERNVLKSGLN